MLSRLCAAACGALLFLTLVPSEATACGSFGNYPPARPAPVCNYWRCTVDGWIAWPKAAGTACTVNGEAGLCDGGLIVQGQLEPERLGKCQITKTLRVDGNYAIAAVWYVPPGPGSATVYGAASVTGTSISGTSGMSNTFSIGVSNQAGFLGLMAGAYDISYTQMWSKSSTTKMDSLITYTVDNTVPGPGFESLNHNYDQIVLLLGPEIVFTGYTSNGTLTALNWALDSSRAILYPVWVGWLNGAFGPMPANVAADLYAYGGITAADFPQILAADPYAYDTSGAARPNPDHYECVEQLYYVPGYPNLEGYGITNSYTSSDSTTVSHSYTVRLALSGTWLSQKLNASDSFTWSNSSTWANSFQSTGSAKLNLHQPSPTYAGPTILHVYVDKIYKTLFYSFLPPITSTTYCLGEADLNAVLAAQQ